MPKIVTPVPLDPLAPVQRRGPVTDAIDLKSMTCLLMCRAGGASSPAMEAEAERYAAQILAEWDRRIELVGIVRPPCPAQTPASQYGCDERVMTRG